MIRLRSVVILIVIAAASALAASNIDNVVPNKHAWSENCGWTNWRDADGGAQGVNVGGFIMQGYVWGENIGWIHMGDGTPGAPPFYSNAGGADHGVNIAADGSLSGFAWSENAGWINFSGGSLATPAQPARITCAGRLTGFAWAENLGWINLSLLTPTHFVAVEPAVVPILCDMNHDGLKNGLDVQPFVNVLLLGGAGWQDLCSGDLVPPPGLSAADVAAFVACLLSP